MPRSARRPGRARNPFQSSPSRRGNFSRGSDLPGALRCDIGRHGLVFVRNTDPHLDFAAMQAVEPELLRMGLRAVGTCVDVLHGKIFDSSLDCGDPFVELRRSRLTGNEATDMSLLATLLFYRDAHFALKPGTLLLPTDHEQDLLAMVGALCENEGTFLAPDARRLSVLAQHTLFSLGEQARLERGTELVISMRRLIAQGRLHAMLDPRRMFR